MEPAAEEPKAEEPKVEEPKAEEPVVEKVIKENCELSITTALWSDQDEATTVESKDVTDILKGLIKSNELHLNVDKKKDVLSELFGVLADGIVHHTL